MSRDDSVSMAKGFAILLMVLAHSEFSHYGDTYINMFHMPLFFFMSGYCFKEAYLDDFLNFAKRRIKGAYWPFVKWCLLFLILHNVFYSLNIYNGEYGYHGEVSQVYALKDFLRHGLAIVGCLGGNEQLLGGYWFLHSYFFAAFISFGTIFLFRNHISYVAAGACALLALSVMMAGFDIEIPHYIGAREVLASSFMVTGFAYRQAGWHLEEKAAVIIPLGAVIVAAGACYWPCGMLTFTWQKTVPYYLSALAGTIMVFSLCKFLDKSKPVRKVMTYIGDRTLDILTWHLLSFKAVSLIIISAYGITITRLAEFPVIEEYTSKGWWILYFIVGVLMSLLIERLLSGLKHSLQK